MFTRIFPPFEYKTNVVHFNYNVRPYSKPVKRHTIADSKTTTAKCTHLLPCKDHGDIVENDYIVVDESTADTKVDDFVLL